MGPESEAQQIEATLREHVRARYLGGRSAVALDTDDDLLESGIVDSMGVIELTSFLEEQFGLSVEPEDIVPDNFRSLGTMTRYVAGRKGIGTEDTVVAGMRSLVAETVPDDAVVLVASHGDDALLALDGRTGWHFPRDEKGGYGYKPADGAEAIRQLETLRSLGATHIVFPEPALWWLEEYAGLRGYLESGSGEVGRSEAGVVYALPAA
jgi:acyl carrier protein